MSFLAFLYDVFLIKPNQWYDSLPEPNRFLTFIIPYAVLILTLSYKNQIWILMGIMIITFIYRICYFNTKARNKEE